MEMVLGAPLWASHHPVGAADSKGLASRRTAARREAPLWARPVFGTVGGCTDHRETRVIADGRVLAHVVMRHYGVRNRGCGGGRGQWPLRSAATTTRTIP